MAPQTVQGGQQILNLRVHVQSKRWGPFWDWHLQHSDQHADGAADRLLRSLAYHRGKLKKSSQRFGQVIGEMGYFRHNRDKVNYAACRATGLITSSGPVEAAAKTISNAVACAGQEQVAATAA